MEETNIQEVDLPKSSIESMDSISDKLIQDN